MVKSCTKIQEKPNNSYNDILNRTELALKQMKNEDSSLTQNERDMLHEHMGSILDFMSRDRVYKQKNYSRSIIILDNILVLDKEIISQLSISEFFLQNLHQYFIRISIHQFEGIQQYNQHSMSDQNRKAYQDYQNILYGCLYLILLIISKMNHNPEIKSKITKQLFNVQFIKSLLQLQVQVYFPKLIRVISMILSYLFTNKSMLPMSSKYIKSQFKRMSLELISKSQEETTNTYLAAIIKSLVNQLKIAQIHKYRVLNFLISCLQSKHEKTVKNSLITILYILKKFGSLADALIQLRLMKYWDQNFANYPDICLKILKLVLPHFSVSKKQEWFRIYMTHILQKIDQNKISHVHFEIVSYLVIEVSANMFMQTLENGWIRKLQLKLSEISSRKSEMNTNIRIKQAQQLLRREAQKFTQNFMNRLKQINQNVYNIYINVYQESNLLTLANLS